MKEMSAIVFGLCSAVLSGCSKKDSAHKLYEYYGNAVKQVSISRIASMPDMPSPYKMLDWEQKAKDFDAYVFNEETSLYGKSLIWYDDSRRNIDQETFGIYTAVNDSRQGLGVNIQSHESVTSLPALIGGTLVGVDKTNQNGRNYVKMVQNYFNSDNGWNIMMNNTAGGGTTDWWYIVFPNVLYYALCDLYPDVDGAEEIQRSIADQFAKADETLAGNYDYSYFNYASMKGYRNSIPYQQDAAGGHAWVLYAAYRKFGDEKYLEHAKSSIEALLSQTESRFYEVLMPMGAIAAARMNAEQGTSYDVKKIIDWTFNGCSSSSGRTGWGVIVGTWGGYDVSGLQGSTTDGGGYAFFMNSVKLAWPMVPIVKYYPEYAASIGKWVLNLANACRLFYPTEIDDAHQWLPELKDITSGNIAYEGLRKYDKYDKSSLKGVSPVALGDGPQWVSTNGEETMFSVYSTAPVGILGALVQTTDVEGILRINCNVTDFYADRPYPVYLLYNPYGGDMTVTLGTEGSKVDLFDSVSRTYLAVNVKGASEVTIPSKSAVVITELPSGTDLKEDGDRLVDGKGNVICWE